MAIYRNVYMAFWTDSKVVDDFTPEDKYFYVYLITNPHTNLCGCYEISMKQMSDELGYNKETIEKLIDRFHKVHKVLDYNSQTKEMLLYNWSKYNWTKSPKLQAALLKEIPKVKCPEYSEFLNGILNGDTVSIPYEYGMDTPDTDTDTNTDIVSDSNNTKKTTKKQKHKYGEYQKVLLTDSEYKKLADDYGEDLRNKAIRFLDEYIEEKGYTSKSHNLAIRRWVMDAVNENEAKQKRYGRKEIVPKWMNNGERQVDDQEKAAIQRMMGNDPDLAERAEKLKQRLGNEYG